VCLLSHIPLDAAKVLAPDFCKPGINSGIWFLEIIFCLLLFVLDEPQAPRQSRIKVRLKLCAPKVSGHALAHPHSRARPWLCSTENRPVQARVPPLTILSPKFLLVKICRGNFNLVLWSRNMPREFEVVQVISIFPRILFIYSNVRNKK
jgi:hypothetical protein